MYRTILFIVISLVIELSSFAQAEGCRCQITAKTIPEYDKPLVGKPFYNNYPLDNTQFYTEWFRADISLSDGTVRNKLVCYNALLDEFIWKRDGDSQLIVINRKNIIKVQYVDDGVSDIAFIKIDKKNLLHPQNGDMFVKLLSNGKGQVQLLKKISVEENQSTHSLEESEQYLLSIDGDYKSLHKSKSSLLRLLGAGKEEMKEIISRNHLSVKKEVELIVAINLYNSFNTVMKKNKNE